MFFKKFLVVFAFLMLAPAGVAFAGTVDTGDAFMPKSICPNPEFSANQNQLMQGDYGMAVEFLQQKLGIWPEDGCFGPATHSAVEKFQACHGLAVDGLVGWQTMSALNNGKSLKGCASQSPATSGQQQENFIVIDQWREVVRLKNGDTTIDTMPMIDNHEVLTKGTYKVCEFVRNNKDHSHTWRLPNFVRLCKEDGARTGIGFHAIPVSLFTGRVMNDDSYLGTGRKRSSGCIRLSLADSLILWDFAKTGMRVVVV